MLKGYIYICQNFIKNSGFAARCCKHTKIDYSSRVTSSQITERLYTNLSHLKEYKVSFRTIKQFFEAPNKLLKVSFMYNGFINLVKL